VRQIFEDWILELADKIDLMEKLGLSGESASGITELIYFGVIIFICFIIYLFSRKILIRVLQKIILNSPYKWDNAFLDSKFVHRSINIIPALIFYYLAFLLPSVRDFVEIVAVIFISFMAVSAIFGFLDAINCIYDKNYTESKAKPIKGFLQIMKIAVFILALVLVISSFLRQSPLYILSGLGALSAVTMLIFKDSILGMVAGIQMASNDLVRIGDWIEMPKYGADGDVIDISLTVVKVENFDRTITTIPAYALVSDSFKNWRGMQAAGGRRIKRSIYLDAASIEFCSAEKIDQMKKIKYLQEYIETRLEEIKKYNEENQVDTSMPVNGRRLTNIGVFRKYVEEYLKNHPKIHKSMIIMVRQLAPGKDGIPLEVYAFTNDTNWANYETIMADIFDHLYSVVPYFDLNIFQEPSGQDIRMLGAQRDGSSVLNQ